MYLKKPIRKALEILEIILIVIVGCVDEITLVSCFVLAILIVAMIVNYYVLSKWGWRDWKEN